MGWGRALFLGDVGNQMDIQDIGTDIAALSDELERSRQSDRSQDEVIGLLQRENDELKLYIATLARLLVQKGVFSQNELRQMVEAVDRSDGTRDGRFTGEGEIV